MKFSTREDIEAPMDYVFGRISDFASFEKRALRQGAQVARRQTGAVSEGDIWDIAFSFRGRDRKVVATLVQLDPAQGIRIDSVSDGLTALTQVELVALSPARTRVMVTFELKPGSLTARLLVQSLKLAKAKLAKRFSARVLSYAEDIEDAYRRGG